MTFESERLQRLKQMRYLEHLEADEVDQEFATRIVQLLNSEKIDKGCMVDAFYYDLSMIPDKIKERFNLCSDSYLIFGITSDGEIISKWVDRWDLDSEDSIVDGKVVRSELNTTNFIIPEINQFFDANLLSNSIPECIKKLFEWKRIKQ